MSLTASTPANRAMAARSLTESRLAGRLIALVFAVSVIVFLVAVLAL